MAYDEALAQRTRDLLHDEPSAEGRALAEKRMFGGLAFLVDGRMAVAVSGQGGLMVRVDPEEATQLLAGAAARPVEMRGRPMTGWVRVDAEGLVSDDALAAWVARGAAFAATLPAR